MPKTYYHGTAHEFEELELQDEDGLGIWLVDEPEPALSYAYTCASRTGEEPRVLKVEFAGGSLASRAMLTAAMDEATLVVNATGTDRRAVAKDKLAAQGHAGIDMGGGVILVFKLETLKIVETEVAEWPNKVPYHTNHGI